MQDVRIDRLSLDARAPILQYVIGEKPMKEYSYRIPSAEELYAVEAAARRLRAEAMSDAFRKAVASLKSLFVSRSVRHA
jgi:hypothetical protein